MEFEKFETIRHGFYDSFFLISFFTTLEISHCIFSIPFIFVNVVFDNYVGNNAQKERSLGNVCQTASITGS